LSDSQSQTRPISVFYQHRVLGLGRRQAATQRVLVLVVEMLRDLLGNLVEPLGAAGDRLIAARAAQMATDEFRPIRRRVRAHVRLAR